MLERRSHWKTSSQWSNRDEPETYFGGFGCRSFSIDFGGRLCADCGCNQSL